MISRQSSSARREVQTLRTLVNAQGEAVLGSKYIVKLFDEFQHSGPNGVHTCLVLELLGPNISQAAVQFDHQRLPRDFAKRVSKQVLLGLQFMHQHSVAHGGKNGPFVE